MPTKQARLSLRDLAQLARTGSIETVIVAFTDHYGRLMGKRFDVTYFLEHVTRDGAHACDYLLTTDMEMDPVPGYRFANWELGYGDFHMVPDMPTLRTLSWLDKTAFVHCDVENVPVSPRAILRRQVGRAAAMGYQPMAASELEYYIFKTPYREAARQGYQQMEPLGWYLEDYNILQGTREEFYTAAVRRHLKESGITVENSKGEWGLGQHEINIRYSDVLGMADDHALFKQCLKEIADQVGVSVTFMAKHAHGQAGSGCHHPPEPAAARKERVRRQTNPAARFAAPTCSAGSSAAGSHTFPTSWFSTRPPSTLISGMRICPGRQPASPGAMTTAPPASAWWATAPASASSAVSPGPT
jgi:glutamine synthetase